MDRTLTSQADPEIVTLFEPKRQGSKKRNKNIQGLNVTNLPLIEELK
jgi:hypothetical protein